MDLPTLSNEMWVTILDYVPSIMQWIKMRSINRQIRNVIDGYLFGKVISLTLWMDAQNALNPGGSVRIEIRTKYCTEKVKVLQFYAKEAFCFLWERTRNIQELALMGNCPRLFGPWFITTEPKPTAFYWLIKQITKICRKLPKRNIKKLHFRPYASLKYGTQANQDQLQVCGQLLKEWQHTLESLHIQIEWKHLDSLIECLKPTKINEFSIYFGPSPPPTVIGYEPTREHNPFRTDVKQLQSELMEGRRVTSLSFFVAYHDQWFSNLTMNDVTEELKNMGITKEFHLELPRRSMSPMNITLYPFTCPIFQSRQIPHFWVTPTPFQRELRTLSFGPNSAHRDGYQIGNIYFHVWPPKALFPKLTTIKGLVMDDKLLYNLLAVFSKTIPVDHATTLSDELMTIWCRPIKRFKAQFLAARQVISDWKVREESLKPVHLGLRPLSRVQQRSKLLLLHQKILIEDLYDDNFWSIQFTCRNCSSLQPHRIKLLVPLDPGTYGEMT
jgi:hypothetical protein